MLMMNRQIPPNRIEREIEATIRECGVERSAAEAIVGLRHGEMIGDGDQLCLSRLTDEQKRQLGIGQPIDEVVAEE